MGNHLTATAVVALFLATGLTAQTDRVVPSWCTHHEGGGSNTYIGGHQGMRMQVIYHGSQIATTKGLILKIGFRRDTGDPKAYAAKTIDRTILLDHVPKTPAQLQGSFAANRGTNPTKVFDVTGYKLPATPAWTGAGPAPFTVDFVLSKPFMYDRSLGHLLLEMVGGGPPNTYQEWRVDSMAHGYGTPHLATPMGQPCAGAGSQRLDMQVNNSNLVCGGTLAWDFTSTIAKPSSLLVLIGASASQLGPVPLPLDLGFLGATGCTLRTSVQVAVALPASGSGFPGYKTAIPKDPALGMQEVFTQAIALAPQANPAGLLTSQGQRCLIWPPVRPTTVSNVVMAPDASATTGSISRTPYAPVTRFFGNLP